MGTIYGNSIGGLRLYSDGGNTNGLEINTSGYASATTRFGIGNDSPSKLLHIGKNGGNSGSLRFEASDGDQIDVEINTSDQLEVNGGDLKLDTDGKVGFENSTSNNTFFRTEFSEGTITCISGNSCSTGTDYDVIFFDDYITIYLNHTEGGTIFGQGNQVLRPGFRVNHGSYTGDWQLKLISGAGGDDFASNDLEDRIEIDLNTSSIIWTTDAVGVLPDDQFHIEDEGDGEGYRTFWLMDKDCPAMYRVTYHIMSSINTAGVDWKAIVEAWYYQ